MAVANFRACELGRRDLSSNSGLSGETGGHSLESARTGPAQRIKSIANEGKTWGARMASPTSSPWPGAWWCSRRLYRPNRRSKGAF